MDVGSGTHRRKQKGPYLVAGIGATILRTGWPAQSVNCHPAIKCLFLSLSISPTFAVQGLLSTVTTITSRLHLSQQNQDEDARRVNLVGGERSAYHFELVEQEFANGTF